jgi:hypothetical protein
MCDHPWFYHVLPCDKRRGFQGIFEAWATIALGKFLHLHHVFLAVWNMTAIDVGNFLVSSRDRL